MKTFDIVVQVLLVAFLIADMVWLSFILVIQANKYRENKKHKALVIGGIEVIDYYDTVDKNNIQKYEDSEPYDDDRYAYTCVICGRKTSIDGSFSDRGHNMICAWCFREHFNCDLLKMIKWCYREVERSEVFEL